MRKEIDGVDFDLIDHFEKITDEDAARYTRKLAKEEGIFAGDSCGAAVKGVIQLKKYFYKIFSNVFYSIICVL